MSINVRCVNCKSDFKVGTRICPKCGKRLEKQNRKYRVRAKLPDGKWTSKVCETYEQAKSVEAKIRSDIVDGQYYKHKSAPTLDAIFQRYIKSAKTNVTSWKDIKQRYETYIKPYLGGKELNKIIAADVDDTISLMMTDTANNGKSFALATVKHVLVIIKRLFNWAKEQGLWGGDNPARYVKLPAFDNSVENYMSRQQLDEFASKLNSWKNKRAVRFLQFLLLTGRRRGEVRYLTWDDIDFAKGWMTLEASKVKQRRRQSFPLNEAALHVLKESYKDKISDLCFPTRTGRAYLNINNIWNEIRKGTSFSNVRLHDLRHTFASFLHEAGASLSMIQRLVGHRSIQMTQRYAHLPDHLLKRSINDHGKILGSVIDKVKSLPETKDLPEGIIRRVAEMTINEYYEEMGREIERLGYDPLDPTNDYAKLNDLVIELKKKGLWEIVKADEQLLDEHLGELKHLLPGR